MKQSGMHWCSGMMVMGLWAWCLSVQSTQAESLRRIISLNDVWQVAEGNMTNVTTAFDRTVPVPGLVDMAKPAFAEVGVKSKNREAFWYKRTFLVKQAIPEVALLKLHKAMFGSKVILNGKELGEHQPSFTPGYFDVKDVLRQGENEIVIRVGAWLSDGAKSVGWDMEKRKFIPGIFDSVELIFTGTPHIDRVQAVPDLEKQAVTVHVWPAGPVHATVHEARSGRVVGEADGVGPLTIPIPRCRLWSPEDPFLYELTVHTAGDELTTRFGMRTFRLDPQTGRAILNGKPYFLRGSNLALYRFFEDGDRAGLPWNEAWVRKLHRRCKDMHWNVLRNTIGFPPEFWYRIADEEGILIQDEFPIWFPYGKPGDINGEALAGEYRDWMQERWNHPCVVIWDACNETKLPETGAALAKVRGLDFSARPWDNGWNEPALSNDVRELHPYHFYDPYYMLEQLPGDPGTLDWKPGKNPIIINEYGWLWLNRDGTPTLLTKRLYENLLGPQSTTAQRRHLYARYLAVETEFWRARRALAGVMQFCVLGYSKTNGYTSDHWLDVGNLTWEPEFYRYVRDAFAPVGVMIDDFAPSFRVNQPHEFPLVVINDLDKDWKGRVLVQLLQGGKVVAKEKLSVEVPAWGATRLTYKAVMPTIPGDCQLKATLLKTPDGNISSLRDFTVFTPELFVARNGIAVGKPATASSSVKAAPPGAAVDGTLASGWEANSGSTEPQWLAVDLVSTVMVGRVELAWGKGYAKSYTIQVSSDGKTWSNVYTTTSGKGGTETIPFTPIASRWVRFYGTERADKDGYRIREFCVFEK